MKKQKVIVLTLVLLVFLIGVPAFAAIQPNGDPFQAIWSAIRLLQNQVANIQLIPGPQGERGPAGTSSWDESRITALEARLTTIENALPCIKQVGDEIIIKGCNVTIINGEGNSWTKNGKGNLIIGYNETDGTEDRTGSHNIVIGRSHTYSSYVGLVVGEKNSITGDVASVLGGSGNVASGPRSVVSGGANNESSIHWSSVTGGDHNIASGFYSSVSGGSNQRAIGEASSISGGSSNSAIGGHTTILGGRWNNANGEYSALVGGYFNVTDGEYSSVGGGSNRTAPAIYNWVAGSLLESN